MGILRSFFATPLAMSLVLVLIVQLLSVRVATGYTHTSFHLHHRDGGRVGFNRITEARAAGDVEDTWDVLAGTPLPPGIGRLHREAREDAGEEGENEVEEEWETGGEEEGEDDGGVEGEEEGKQGTVISHALEKKAFSHSLRADVAAAAEVTDAGAAGMEYVSASTSASLMSTSAPALSTSAPPATQGPCSPAKTAVRIAVTKPADIQARVKHDPTQTVVLTLQNSMVLGKGILFDKRFSCTIFQSAKFGAYTVSYPGENQPAIRVYNTSNVLIMGINFVIKTTKFSPSCRQELPEVGKGIICPAVWIYGSYGVQIAKGYVYGRIDMYRCMKSRIDSMKVTGVWDFAKSNGVLRVGISGIGTKLVRSGIAVSNNEVFGADTPLVVYNGAVGVRVVQNFVHDYGFAGIRCGADVRNQGDCMLGFIGYNYVYSRLRNMTGAADSAGIYYCTHWFNPGNRAECNYVKGGDHCYYLDYNTSGVKVIGGVCYDNWDGLKVNNGKFNRLKHVLVVNALKAPGWCTCLTPTVNNCNKFPGNYWENMRIKYYNTPVFKQVWHECSYALQ
ncbi:unnamed protein product [Closterium sp. NIES-54]